MAQVSVKQVLRGLDGAAVGESVTVQGWVRSRRDSKAGLSFIALSDGSCFDTLQLVAQNTLENYAEEVQKLTTGCSVSAVGTIVQSQGKGQSVELAVQSVTVVGWVEEPETYPASQKRHTFEYLRDVAHLRVRTNTFGAVARVRHTLSQAIHRFFHEQDFYWVHTPIITASDAEGAGELFRVSTLDFMNKPKEELDAKNDFFGSEAYLTVSGQLNVETYCQALSKVYTFGPTFRAENSHTARHLAEFWMVEPEISFADLKDDADLAEAFLRYCIKALLEERPDDMAFFDKHIKKGVVENLEHIVASPFKRVTYTEAVDALLSVKKKKFEFPVKWGMDLQTEHERFLTEVLYKQPIIVTDYPKEIKAFYMRLNDDDKTVAAMDVLCPGIGEIIGGSQREERLDVLDARIEASGLPKESYWWYRDLRKYGTTPHAGFGLGFDRFVMFCTGMANIRDVVPFPRTPNQCDF